MRQKCRKTDTFRGVLLVHPTSDELLQPGRAAWVSYGGTVECRGVTKDSELLAPTLSRFRRHSSVYKAMHVSVFESLTQAESCFHIPPYHMRKYAVVRCTFLLV